MIDKRKLIVIGGGVALAFLLGLGLFFILNRGESQKVNILTLAEDYADQGEYQIALNLINEFLIKDANDEDAKALRDKILAARKAVGDAERSVELDVLRAENEQLTQSLETFEESVNRENLEEQSARVRAEEELRSRVEALTARGRGALEEGRYNDAIDDAKEALGLIPDSRLAQNLKSDAERARRDAESAAEKAAREEREKKLAQLLADSRQALKKRRYSEARDLAGQAQQLDPESGDAWAVEGEAWYQEDPDSRDKRRKAQDAFEEALKRNPEDWNTYYRLGQIALAEKEVPKAIDSFQNAVRLSPNQVQVWYELGKAQYRSRQYEDASQSFEKVSQLEPDFQGNWFNLGLSYIKTNRGTEAANAFGYSVRAWPDHAASHYELGKILLASQDWSKAADAFTTAVNLAPGQARYWRSLGAAYYGADSLQEARVAYRRAQELDPNHGNTQYNLALIALHLGDVDEALSNAAAAVRSDNTNAVYFYTLGQAAEEAGLLGDAETSYRKAASLDPGYSKPRINLGVIYDEQGDYDQALKYLLQALNIEKNSPTVWNNLGKVYLHKEDYTNSLKYFEEAAIAAPKDPEVQLNLALTLTETGAAERARGVYRRVIDLDPYRGEAYDRLARLLISSGDVQGASLVVNDLRKALPSYSGLADLENLVR